MKKIDIKPDCIFSPQPMYIIGTKNVEESANEDYNVSITRG